MSLYISSAFVILLASCLHSATGFGFSILAVPLLLLLHDPITAVQINLIIAVILSIVMMPQVRRDVDYTLLKRLVASGLVGVPLGMALILLVRPVQLKLMIAVLTMVFLVALLMQVRFDRTRSRDAMCGALAGAFTSAVGMGGVPLLVYFAGAQLPKAVVRATVVAFFVFAYGLSLAMQLYNAQDSSRVILFSFSLVPLALLGVACGNWLFTRISQRAFRVFIYVVLASNSAFLLWSLRDAL
ncbi:sulfite exporter TauE/SafE family protein [Diaphorobacter caeni]|uniref:sulfite exporter TauE/SafE family protein n=1 Tax=Diaphorobacter caeni TaxID=2784387 RepID=UPI00188ECF6D|nr:sulfite exporter TauE/SafE family protein [Diaphorobacter caeni]MBF5007318.1 sulfite exporter TauE/SafE family protein [Diaphorobacter caeni]